MIRSHQNRAATLSIRKRPQHNKVGLDDFIGVGKGEMREECVDEDFEPEKMNGIPLSVGRANKEDGTHSKIANLTPMQAYERGGIRTTFRVR